MNNSIIHDVLSTCKNRLLLPITNALFPPTQWNSLLLFNYVFQSGGNSNLTVLLRFYKYINGIDIIVHADLISPGAMNPVYPLPAFTSRTFRTKRQLELPTDLCILNSTDSRPQCPEIVRLKEISQS